MFPSRRITMGGDVFRDEYSLAFDGSNDYINVGTGVNSAFNTDFTISSWVKQTSAANATIFSANDATSDGVRLIMGGSQNCKLRLNDAEPVTTGNPCTLGVWNHVVGVYSDTDNVATLYVNGVLEISESQDKSIGVTQFATIGTLSYNLGTNDWNGNISEIAIYDTALSASQVATIYNGREPYNHKEGVASGNLASWWRMGDGLERHSGTTIYDMSNNTNNGTMTNMAAEDFTGDTP